MLRDPSASGTTGTDARNAKTKKDDRDLRIYLTKDFVRTEADRTPTVFSETHRSQSAVYYSKAAVFAQTAHQDNDGGPRFNT